MARAVPLLPCGSLDEAVDFYRALGFEVVSSQHRPYAYAALRRDDLDLQVYGMPDWDPETSHSTCLIIVDDTEALWSQWAAGLRARYGGVPSAGIPRMTRPRRRANAEGASGFSVVDPSGNWLRVFRDPDAPASPAATAPTSEPTSALARAVENAVVLSDSKGDTAQALKVLAGAEGRAPAGTPPADRVAALSLLAELRARTGDVVGARATLDRLDALPLDDAGRAAAHDALAAARELADDLGQDAPG